MGHHSADTMRIIDRILLATRLVPDGACCLSTGMVGNARCSTLFWAIRENFQAEGRPHDLTWIAVGGQGGRGRAPGRC